MHAFDYHRPTSLTDAKALYATLEDPMYVSGGMTLIPSMKQRFAAPSDLIDLSSLSELQGIAQLNDAHGATLRVGGLTRHNEVADSALIQQHMPVLGQVAAAIGDNQVRNRGTLGGSIANADPAADLPAALLAMKAVVNTQDRHLQTTSFSICSKPPLMQATLSSAWISHHRCRRCMRNFAIRRQGMQWLVSWLRATPMACALV